MDIKDTVANYYGEAIALHGPTPQGVDWNSSESQIQRFLQLSKVLDDVPETYSILDYGCGWGAYLAYLKQHHHQSSFEYWGYDIVPAMLEHARSMFGKQGSWLSELSIASRYNFLIASGIFNVRQQYSDEHWFSYIIEQINSFNRMSLNGFAFNMLTKYSDPEYMRNYLFYADPCQIFDYCKRHFSKKVALLHDYPLYEFTIIVRK